MTYNENSAARLELARALLPHLPGTGWRLVEKYDLDHDQDPGHFMYAEFHRGDGLVLVLSGGKWNEPDRVVLRAKHDLPFRDRYLTGRQIGKGTTVALSREPEAIARQVARVVLNAATEAALEKLKAQSRQDVEDGHAAERWREAVARAANQTPEVSDRGVYWPWAALKIESSKDTPGGSLTIRNLPDDPEAAARIVEAVHKALKAEGLS